MAYAAVVAAGVPLYGHFVDWPRFLRHFREDPHRARIREYWETIVVQWALFAVGIYFWRSGVWDAPTGWRAWAAAALIALLAATHAANIVKATRSARTRAWLREHMAYVEPILPATDSEFAGFLALSITAGICEEFLFRGYVIWAFAPLLGWWGAAALSLASFALSHSYQGRKGLIQSLILGALLTLLVAITRSLLPAMALHALIDAGSGTLAWISLRKQPGESNPAGI